ncbi:Lonp1 [Symbiodinium natans]|uniref:peptidylprolyl isomerase n=1 Tax=Symbiodinium natans TaxID=878477 RepID=A0A812HWJ1_9DINO|nr:Lonp1 [Symbiodinium natans]
MAMRGAQSGTKRRWRPWRLALACLALLFSCFSDSSSAFLEAGAASRRRSMTLQWFAASLLGELPAVAEGENVDLGYEKMDRLKGSLAKKRTKMPDFTPLPSGLQIKDADPGRVGMPAAKEGDYVVFTWEGYTINYFGRPFETRTLQKMSGIDPDPVRFRVGDGKVIKGIDEGVRGMHEGGIRQLIVPVELSSQVMDNKGGLMDKTLLINVAVKRVYQKYLSLLDLTWQVTGQLGSVMSEPVSSSISLTYARLFMRELDSSNTFLDTASIHLHVPEGATPKDGPSAGVTMTSALVSSAVNAALVDDIAMTGELTLMGKVLKVGGIKEKVIAARREGVKTLLLPRQNEADFMELKDYLRAGLTAHFVDHYDDVYQLAFDQSKVPPLRGPSRGLPVITVVTPEAAVAEQVETPSPDADSSASEGQPVPLSQPLPAGINPQPSQTPMGASAWF